MIAATRAIVVTSPRRGNSVSQKQAERETMVQAVVETAPAPRVETPRYPATLPLAPFVAQLIATHQPLPPTRARNRAEQSDAAAAYRRTSRSLG